MKKIFGVLVVALVASISVAQAATVYVSRISTSVHVASANAEAAWKAQYPNGTYWGIFRCANAGGATGQSPYWECVAYGEDNISNNVSIVTASARDMMPAVACNKAITAWTTQYGATGTLTGTSIIEVYGNGPNQRPTEFVCTASGTIPR
jgi:hypothetical protein